MIKSLARAMIKTIPQNMGLFLLLKKIGVPNKVSQYLDFKNTIYTVNAGQKKFKLYSNGILEDNRIFWRGIESSENYSIKIWEYLCTNNKVILDIGANIGIFAILAKCINGESEVHGFEPLPTTFSRFKKNVEVNGYDIVCHELALSNENGKGKIFVEKDNGQTPSLNNIGKGTSIDIEMRTLDSMMNDFKSGKIDLMKIDVETYEPEVLQGMAQILNSSRPTMIIEVLENSVGNRVQQLLDGLGYLYFYIDEEKGLISVNKIERLSRSRNYLICQKDVAENILENFPHQ